MLLQFSVGNFLSIKEEQTLSMVASKLTGHEEDNIFDYDDIRVLKSAVIYGPNASGKSNFIAAIRYMGNMVIGSVQNSMKKGKLRARTFALDESMADQPSKFEVIFAIKDKTYRYGFEVSEGLIIREELYFTPNSREALLFKRENNNYSYGVYFEKEAKGLEEKTHPGALFLTVAAQFNSSFAKKVLQWFANFNAISGISSDHYRDFTADKIIEDSNFKAKVSNMMRKADMGIESVEARNIDSESLPTSLPKDIRLMLSDSSEVFTVHKVKTRDGQNILKSFNMDAVESEGTRKYFALAGPIIDTLENGGVLVVDELDAKLHSLLTRHILQLFNSTESNPNNAQLIFATHDTTLLSLRYFRRDQIWFVNKGGDASSVLYALSDYKDEEGKGIRKDSSIQIEYFQGKFDAIPFIQE